MQSVPLAGRHRQAVVLRKATQTKRLSLDKMEKVMQSVPLAGRHRQAVVLTVKKGSEDHLELWCRLSLLPIHLELQQVV